MSVSNTSIELVKTRLSQKTLSQLKEEAEKYGIKLSPENSERYIDAIIDHLIRNGPLESTNNEQSQEARGEPNALDSSIAENPPGTSTASKIFPLDANSQQLMDKTAPQSNAFLLEQMRIQKEYLAQQQSMLLQMQQMFMTLFSVGGSIQNQPLMFSPNLSDLQESQNSNFKQVSDTSVAAIGQSVKFLSMTIATFGGTEEENVSLWLEKIEAVATNHNLSDMVKLSAATSKLTKIARRWYDLSSGDINSSWDSFKSAITRRFKRRMLLSLVMQKVENRKWNFSSESFQEYAMDKLALMQPLKLEDEHTIELLIKGIPILAIKSVAASLRTDSIDDFLDEMHRITITCDDSLRKSLTPSVKLEKARDNTFKANKPKDQSDLNIKNSPLKQDIFCVYCRNKGHLREDCLKLKNKEQRQESVSLPAAPLVAAVSDQPMEVTSLVAAVSEQLMEMTSMVTRVDNVNGRQIIANKNILKIIKLNNVNCDLIALPDNGSPISFICPATFNRFFKSIDIIEVNSNQRHRALNKYTDFYIRFSIYQY